MLTRKSVLRTSNVVILLLITLVLMLPVIHALSRSLAPPGYLNNYVQVINDSRLPRFYLNSLIVSGGTIALTVFCASVAAFAFAKLDFPLRNVLFYLLLITLLVPASTLIIPLFVLIRSLGLYNTHLGLILPQVAFGVPFHTVLIRNYFNSLPNELIDAARIDGCTNFGVFWRIMMPLSKPVQVVVITLTFLGSWNNYLLPLLMLKDQAMYTVPVAAVSWAYQAGSLAQFGDVAYETLFAALFTLAAPTIIIFLALQRVFIGSVTAGAIRT
jgi:raffinose/stachyose/melibiose transport system permease protein